jgi:hypothetical protein
MMKSKNEVEVELCLEREESGGTVKECLYFMIFRECYIIHVLKFYIICSLAAAPPTSGAVAR